MDKNMCEKITTHPISYIMQGQTDVSARYCPPVLGGRATRATMSRRGLNRRGRVGLPLYSTAVLTLNTFVVYSFASLSLSTFCSQTNIRTSFYPG